MYYVVLMYNGIKVNLNTLHLCAKLVISFYNHVFPKCQDLAYYLGAIVMAALHPLLLINLTSCFLIYL